MRVLLVTQYFYPENFKSNDVAFELAARGHDVTVLTGLPNYPGGKIFDGYGMFRRRVETVNGVKVLRTLVVPRGNGGGMRLALNYLSWAFIASVWAFFLALFRKYDAVIVHETSPITQGFPALVVKAIQRIPMYFWVLDLWPESLQAAGNINNRYVLGLFSRIAALMYRNSSKILMSSKGFRESILDKGDFEDRLVYFPNWAEDVFSTDETKPLPELPDGFKIMFAGNIGEAQDFENVMNAALLLKGTGVRMVIVGDGRKKQWVDRFVEENMLQDVVYMMGRYPL
ncbi:MAG: glycosyltransferase family 4 protein, partial [Bacteroidales bacterium]|nr:glycosyltransferase family 4 protein [Bacteroidales bacterium]